MNKKGASSLLILMSTLVGCANPPTTPTPIFSVASATASQADMAPSADMPVAHFNREDVVFFYVRLSWANAATPQGYRLIEWRWMKGDQIVATNTTRYLFTSAPRDIRTRMPASTLGEGLFTVAAYLDGRLLDKQAFTIKNGSLGP